MVGTPIESVIRSASAGRPAPASSDRPSSVDRGDLLGIGETVPSGLVRGERAVDVAPPVEAGRGESPCQVGALWITEWLSPHGSDDVLDLVVMPLGGMGLGEHLGTITDRDVDVVGGCVDKAHGKRRVVAEQRQAGGRSS